MPSNLKGGERKDRGGDEGREKRKGGREFVLRPRKKKEKSAPMLV